MVGFGASRKGDKERIKNTTFKALKGIKCKQMVLFRYFECFSFSKFFENIAVEIRETHRNMYVAVQYFLQLIRTCLSLRCRHLDDNNSNRIVIDLSIITPIVTSLYVSC